MKSTGKNKLLGLALPLCLAWALAPAAQAKNSLRCTIVDEAGNAVAKREIQLTLTQTGKQWKRKTNDKGEVRFKGLNDGTYQLGGENINGYLVGKTDPIELSGNTEKPCQQTIYSVNYFLRLQQDVLQAVQQRKYDLAVDKGKMAVDLSPETASAHYVLAVGYASKGMETEAMAEVKKAAELDAEKFEKFVTPIHVGALGAQADLALSKKNFENAIEKYERMLEVSPQTASAYYGMSLAYGHQEKYDQALKSIDKAIELKPNDMQFQKMKIRLQDLYLKSMDEKLELK